MIPTQEQLRYTARQIKKRIQESYLSVIEITEMVPLQKEEHRLLQRLSGQSEWVSVRFTQYQLQIAKHKQSFAYALSCSFLEGSWHGTKICTWSEFAEHIAQEVRDLPKKRLDE